MNFSFVNKNVVAVALRGRAAKKIVQEIASNTQSGETFEKAYFTEADKRGNRLYVWLNPDFETAALLSFIVNLIPKDEYLYIHTYGDASQKSVTDGNYKDNPFNLWLMQTVHYTDFEMEQ